MTHGLPLSFLIRFFRRSLLAGVLLAVGRYQRFLLQYLLLCDDRVVRRGDVDDACEEVDRSAAQGAVGVGLRTDLDALIFRLDRDRAAAEVYGTGCEHRLVPGLDVDHAALEVDVAEACALRVGRLDAVLAGLDRYDAAGDQDIVLAADAVVLGGDVDDAALDGQRVGGHDAVVAVGVDDQFAVAVRTDHKRAFGADRCIGDRLEQRFRRLLTLLNRLGVCVVVGEDVLRLLLERQDHHRTGLDRDRCRRGAGQVEVVEHQIDRLALGSVNDDVALLAGSGDHVGAGLVDRQRGAVDGHTDQVGLDSRIGKCDQFLLCASAAAQTQGRGEQEKQE